MVEINRHRHAIREPSLIPMVNVVLLLLVFFLVAGSVEKFEALHVDLPIAKNSKMLSDGQIVVILGAQREVVVNDDFVAPSAFKAAMIEQIAGNSRKIISLRADQSLPASFLNEIMNEIKEAGGTNISLISTPF